MLRLLLAIAVNRDLAGEDHYVRCARCGTIAGPADGAPLITITQVSLGPDPGSLQTPPEWICPSCGRIGPLEIGELLVNDTTVRCRHTFLCRYTWRAPAAVATVTCPRCYTTQPGPAVAQSRDQ